MGRHRPKPLVPRPTTALIYELRKEVRPGLCIYCEERPAKRITCGEKECVKAYLQDYDIQRCALRRKAREERLGQRDCGCGCGKSFVPRNAAQMYATSECYGEMHRRAVRARRAKAKLAQQQRAA